MALHRLEEVSIGAPDPERLDDFYREIGMIGGERSWGTADRPGQIRLAEAPYRQLLSLRILCEDEADLAEAATRLDALGVGHRIANGRLTVRDPVNEWTFIVEPGAVADIAPQPRRTIKEDWNPMDSWSVWGEQQQPEVFFRPVDMDDVVAGWQRAHA